MCYKIGGHILQQRSKTYLRVWRLFIGIVYARETLDLPSPRLLIQPLRVPPLTDFNARLQINLQKTAHEYKCRRWGYIVCQMGIIVLPDEGYRLPTGVVICQMGVVVCQWGFIVC